MSATRTDQVRPAERAPQVTSLLGRRRPRRRRGRRVLVLLLVLALLGSVVWLLRFSSVLTVQHVSVGRVQYVTSEQVVRAAAVPYGQPLAIADLEAVGRRVGALAPVASVRVSRSWPSTLRIQVTERRPRFALDTGPGYALVDAQGIMFGPRDDAPKGMITVNSSTTDSRQLADVATVVGALPPAVRERTRSVRAGSRDAIVVKLSKGDSLMWGSADNSEVKAEVAVALLKRKGSVYNVAVPSHPTVR